MSKLKIGDNVMIRHGKFRTKTGKIERLDEAKGLAWIAGINIVKRHQKKTSTTPQGGIVEKQLPLPVSKVMLIDEKSKKPTRVGLERSKTGTVRVAKKSGEKLAFKNESK